MVAGLAGIAATGGSLLLLGADGAVFATEMTGNEALSRKIEDSQLTQWARIVGTVMTLPDLAVGGVKALREVGALAAEGREAAAASRAATDLAEAQRARAAKISHPSKHPHAVQKHLHKARRFAREAVAHTEAAAEATRKLHKPNTRLQDTTNEVLDRFREAAPSDLKTGPEPAAVLETIEERRAA